MRYFLTIGILMFFLDVSAQQTVRWTNRQFTEEDMNKFRYNGGAIACITSKVPDPERGYLDCLHISDINMDMNVKQVEKLYGKPYKVIDNEDSQIRVYLLPTDGDQYPYVAITYVQESVDVIQLTGASTTKDMDFASIRLGDDHNFVTEILGPPSSMQQVNEINGVLWSYDPFPISVEFIDGSVFSIRIHNNMQK